MASPAARPTSWTSRATPAFSGHMVPSPPTIPATWVPWPLEVSVLGSEAPALNETMAGAPRR